MKIDSADMWKSKNRIRYKWQRYSTDRCHLCFTDIFARVKIRKGR